MQNLLANWKTSFAGLVMIAGAIIHLVFAIRQGKADESTWTASVTAILTGFGFLATALESSSVKAHAESTAAITDLSNKVDLTARSVVSGDTTLLTRADVATAKSP